MRGEGDISPILQHRLMILFGLDTLGVGDPRHIVLDKRKRRRGGGFDAAFAKLLWPHVINVNICSKVKECLKYARAAVPTMFEMYRIY